MSADVTRTSRAAVALRLAGASYSEVADALGFANADEAAVAVERDLSTLSGTEGERAQLRREEAARLERLLRGVWQKALDSNDVEHLAAARTALSIIDRHARLLGLDSPQEMVVYTPTAREIDDWVATLVQEAPIMGVEEAEVLMLGPADV